MAQKNIELILFRQLIIYLSQPVIIIDPEGNLLFCNEAAEKIIGFRFSETGELPEKEWTTIFLPQDKNGAPIPREKLPFYVAHTQRRFASIQCYIRNLKNKICHIEILAVPLINHETLFGTAIFFEEIEE